MKQTAIFRVNRNLPVPQSAVVELEAPGAWVLTGARVESDKTSLGTASEFELRVEGDVVASLTIPEGETEGEVGALGLDLERGEKITLDLASVGAGGIGANLQVEFVFDDGETAGDLPGFVPAVWESFTSDGGHSIGFVLDGEEGVIYIVADPATTAVNGLLSAADKTKLDGIEEGATAGGGGGHIIADEGGDLPQRAKLSFAGAGVTITDDEGGNSTLVTIPGADLVAAPLVWRGEWDDATAYDVGDGVSYDGSSYAALDESTNVTPGTDPATWQLIAERGAEGLPGEQGPPGEQGEQGEPGETGEQGPPGASVTVEEADGSPSVANVTKIKVGNGDLIDEGDGVVRVKTAADAAGGGGGSIIQSFADDFNDNSIDAAKWTTPAASGISETGGLLQIAVSATAMLKSLVARNFHDKSLSVEFRDVDSSSGNLATQLVVSGSDEFTSRWMMDVNGTSLRAWNGTEVARSVTYNATNHRYVRFHFRYGGIRYQTSADGVTWSTIAAAAVTADITALFIYLRVFNTTGASATAKFDNLEMLDWANV